MLAAAGGIVALTLALAGPAALSGALPAALPAAAPPAPDISSATPFTITMTTVNDGRAVSLLDPEHAGWAALGPSGAMARITVTVELNGTQVHQWDARLDTPDSVVGAAPSDCRGQQQVARTQVSCDFSVALRPGVTRLDYTLSADGGPIAHARGMISAGPLRVAAGWEVRDAAGNWSAIPHDRAVDLPATLSSALRYVVTNTGDIPFRVTNGCDSRPLAAHRVLVCPVTGVRPAQSLAGDYRRSLHVVDAVGGTADVTARAHIRSVAGRVASTPIPDAAAASWSWLLLPFGVLVALALVVTLLLTRRRLTRTRSELNSAAPPEPPRPATYPGASPATLEPAAARRP